MAVFELTTERALVCLRCDWPLDNGPTEYSDPTDYLTWCDQCAMSTTVSMTLAFSMWMVGSGTDEYMDAWVWVPGDQTRPRVMLGWWD